MLSSSISNVKSLVFCVWEPCGCSTSDCAILLRSGAQSAWHNERNAPIMRVLSVSPRGAVPWVPSNEVQRGNGIGETPEEGGNLH